MYVTYVHIHMQALSTYMNDHYCNNKREIYMIHAQILKYVQCGAYKCMYALRKF